MTNTVLSEFANRLKPKLKQRPKKSQEEKDREEVQDLTKQLVHLRKAKNAYLNKIDVKDKEIKARLEKLCGDQPGEFHDCIKRHSENYCLSLKKGFEIPSEIPEWINVTPYKTWRPLSLKRRIEIQKEELKKSVNVHE